MEVRDLGGYDGMVFRFPTAVAAARSTCSTPCSRCRSPSSARTATFVSAAPTWTRARRTEPGRLPDLSAAGPYTHALEVPQGGLRRLGVGPGSKLAVPRRGVRVTDGSRSSSRVLGRDRGRLGGPGRAARAPRQARGAGGAMLAAAMLGLAEALEPAKQAEVVRRGRRRRAGGAGGRRRSCTSTRPRPAARWPTSGPRAPGADQQPADGPAVGSASEQAEPNAACGVRPIGPVVGSASEQAELERSLRSETDRARRRERQRAAGAERSLRSEADRPVVGSASEQAEPNAACGVRPMGPSSGAPASRRSRAQPGA